MPHKAMEKGSTGLEPTIPVANGMKLIQKRKTDFDLKENCCFFSAG